MNNNTNKQASGRWVVILKVDANNVSSQSLISIGKSIVLQIQTEQKQSYAIF